jgi:uncharacterized membrane protein YhhN
MAMIKRYGVWLFAIVLVLHCLFIYLEMGELRTLSKILLIPILLLYLYANRPTEGNSDALVYAGLIFSFLGDLILTRSGELFFLLGMLAFIGTHVCNSIFFHRLQKNTVQRGKGRWLAVLLLGVVSAMVFFVLQPYLGSFQWPILFYMCIISCMAVLATGTMDTDSLKKTAAVCFIPGAFLFVVSDALLAMNKFLWHQSFADILVMLTYGAAQYCLVQGFVKTQTGMLSETHPL